MDKQVCNVVTLDSGVEYTEISRLSHDGETFIFLSNLDNPQEFCIKQVINVNGEEYIDGLSSMEQFEELFKLFTQKMIN